MKSVFLTLVFASSSFAFGVELETRHLKLIEKMINLKCGKMLTLNQVSTTGEILQNDNGNRVIGYQSVFTGIQYIDHFWYVKYVITVDSLYADGYDHEAREWGLFSVDHVKCVLQ
jgi:hypothetical protein